MGFHDFEEVGISCIWRNGVFNNQSIKKEVSKGQGMFELVFSSSLFDTIVSSTDVFKVPLGNDIGNEISKSSWGLRNVVEANSEDGRVEHHVTIEGFIEHDGIINVDGLGRNMEDVNTRKMVTGFRLWSNEFRTTRNSESDIREPFGSDSTVPGGSSPREVRPDSKVARSTIISNWFRVGSIKCREKDSVEGMGSKDSINESSIVGKVINLTLEVGGELDSIKDDESSSSQFDDGHLGTNIQAINVEVTADVPEAISHWDELVGRLGQGTSQEGKKDQGEHRR